MTKLQSKIYTLFLLIALVFISCTDDSYETTLIADSLTIEKAKAWYESNIQLQNASDIMKAKNQDNEGSDLKPLLNWDLAELDNDSIWSAVELPWEYENGYVSITYPDIENSYNTNQNTSYTTQKLVILKNRVTNKIYGFKMVILSDTDTDINSNTYFNRDTDLNGLVLFYSLQDEFINGWLYKNGKLSSKLLNDKNSKNNSKSYNAKSAIEWLPIEICYYQFIMWGPYVSEPTLTHCNTTYVYIFTDEVACNDGLGGGFEEPNGDEGGGGGGDNTNPSSTTQAITANIELNTEGILLLNTALEQLLAKCEYNILYNYLTQNGNHFNNVYIDPNITGPAQYNSITGNLVFQSNSYISSDYLQEEFVHLFQNSTYTGGIAQYSNTGHSNIEFEAKLIVDIICSFGDTGCGYSGSTFSNYAYYAKWLSIVTNNSTTFPDFNTLLIRDPLCGNKNYWDFLTDFANNPDKSDYNFPVNNTLLPSGINYINIHSCK